MQLKPYSGLGRGKISNFALEGLPDHLKTPIYKCFCTIIRISDIIDGFEDQVEIFKKGLGGSGPLVLAWEREQKRMK